MIQQIPQVEQFKRHLRDSLRRETLNAHTIKIAKHACVYSRGDQDETVYFIDSGQIKLLMLSPEGKECLLSIHAAGDVFGEFCLSGIGVRQETAIAMEETTLKQITCCQFLTRLSRDSLLEGLAQYLTVLIAEQQQIIAKLVTVDSGQGLGKALLQLARKLDK
jgi:CRP/FNR family transcriptional regulator, cyclic AMP receptor protein